MKLTKTLPRTLKPKIALYIMEKKLLCIILTSLYNNYTDPINDDVVYS